MNERIRFPQVLVIGPQGEQIGVMSSRDANAKASDYELDLLCVAPSANPPVCKILNYGKYRFEQQKKAKESKKRQHVVEIKEVQLTPQIGQHDMDTKIKHATRFLQEGNKVKVALRFRGRQMTHIEVGQEVLDKFISSLEEYAIVEKPALLDGKLLIAVLASKVKK
ncbi:MAG: translation initiation factor IF-3 [Bacilli bacterium]